MFTTHDRVDIYQKWIRLIFISFKLSWRRGRRPRRPAPSMRGISFHFLELLPVLHNLCLNCGNRPHFRDKFSPQKRTLIFGSTQVPVFQDIAFIGTSVPRHRGVLRKDAVPYILLIGMPRIIGTSRTPSPTICLSECRGLSGRRGRRPLHFAWQAPHPPQFTYRNAENYRDVSTSSPRRASQGHRPLHFAYRNAEDYRDVEDIIPYNFVARMPRIIGTSRTPSPTFCFARTPSPTFSSQGHHPLQKQKHWFGTSELSGRQHLVTSACFARTPSPTFSSQGHRPLEKQKHWFGTSELSGRRGRRPLQFRRACRTNSV